MEACGTYIDPEVSDKKLVVFPNPASDEITIKYTLDKAAEVDIRLYDILGHEVRVLFNGRQSSMTYTYHMDLEGLPNGGYILMLKTGNETLHQKILLMK